MAASNEWDEWHLTPSGWVKGTEKTDFALNEVPPPKDRVATFKYQEYISSVHSRMHITWEEMWSETRAETALLIKKFGRYPNDCIRDRIANKPIRM